MNLGGFLGQIVFEGNFGEFYPLLQMGEYLHIGKACTFGLGKYEITIL
jgi:CRISPR/Cas system endoribonuclease Cas6 (RAMP superfamily)